MKITIILNHTQYDIEDTEETCMKILSDLAFAETYCLGSQEESNIPNSEVTTGRECFKNPIQNTITGLVENETDTLMEESPEEPSSDQAMVAIPEIGAGSNPKKEPPWEHKTVLLFINECIKLKADFRNPKIRRRTIFIKIQKAMMEKAGVSFSTNALDTKLKNMKLRYHQILENNKKTTTGRGRMPWPYFELVGEVFEGEVRVKDAPTISSLNACSAANSAVMASTSNRKNTRYNSEAPRSRKSDAFKDRFLEIEERKVAIAEEILIELREMRKIRQQRLDGENIQSNSQH